MDMIEGDIYLLTVAESVCVAQLEHPTGWQPGHELAFDWAV